MRLFDEREIVECCAAICQSVETMAERFRKFFTRGLLVAVLALLGFLFYAVTRPSPPPPPLPNPNGYDDLVKEGQLTSGNLYFGDLNPEQSRQQLFRNVEALKSARIGLSRECRVPLPNSIVQYENEHLPNLPGIKRLALAFEAEGKLAEMDNRRADALKSYLDCIRLGRESARGGLAIDKLVGVACEAFGMRPMQRFSGSLDTNECRVAIQALEKLDSPNESAEEFLKRDLKWGRRVSGWRAWITSLLAFNQTRQAQQKFRTKLDTTDLARRRLMIDLAARAYELENGKRPKTIADLVPDYLKTIPLDPFTGTNIVYQP